MVRCLFILLLFMSHGFALEHYERFVKEYVENETLFITTRRFELQGVTFYLTINTQTLQTKVLALDASRLQPLSSRFDATPFAKLLSTATAHPESGGVTHAQTKLPKAIFLTMDMCPSSKKGYEDAFLAHLTQTNGKTPIAIAMSSAWMEHHPKEFQELINHPLLEITWVNHTHTHFYDRSLEERQNFMLHQPTNVQQEVFGLEQKLLEQGLTPSVFFRFPGLVSDAKLMKELKETYFLVPLSTDAWIAKGQKVKEGSILLIHGNKNEPQGIEALEKELPKLLKTFTFKPLREAFAL